MMARWYTVYRGMGSFIIVDAEPLCSQNPGLLNSAEVMQIQPLVSGCAIESFDIGVLSRLARLEVEQGDLLLLSPITKYLRDLFRTVVTPYGCWLSSPLDDLGQAADDTSPRQRQIDFNAQAFTVVVVQHVIRWATFCRRSVNRHGRRAHEVHRPYLIDGSHHTQCQRLFSLDTAARFDTQIQLQFTIDSHYTFVVPAVPLDVSQVQKTQAEAPTLVSCREAQELIGNELVLA